MSKPLSFKVGRAVWRWALKRHKAYFQRRLLDWKGGNTRKYLSGFEKALGRTVELTDEESRAVAELWGRYGYVVDEAYYKLVKLVKGEFDPHYVPGETFFTHLLPAISSLEDGRVLQDKSVYGFYFSDVRRPHEIFRVIRGVCYDGGTEVLTHEECVDRLLAYGKPVCVKPTIDTGEGKNVKLFQSYDRSAVERMFAEYGANFAVQEVLKQSPQMAAFNASSLNTFRIVSLFLNGRYSLLGATMRVGSPGCFVDNVGAGGFLVRVNRDGTLGAVGYAYDDSIVKTTYAGVPLEQVRIKSFDKVLRFVEKLHKRLPYVAILGWDIALDENDEPVLVELNITQPEANYVQLQTGPLFGDRFDEVMEYAANPVRRERAIRRIASFRPDAQFPVVYLWRKDALSSFSGRLYKRFFSSLAKRYRRMYVRNRGAQLDARQGEMVARFEEVAGRRAELTHAEWSGIRAFWKKRYGISVHDAYYRQIKLYPGVEPDPRFISDEIEYMHLLPAINPIEDCHVFQDKSMYGFYFSDVPRPVELFRCVRGACYGHANDLLTREEAVERVLAYGGRVIVKPTVDNGEGKGVAIFDAPSRETLKSLFEVHGENFTVQELVEQSNETKVFNPTSLNTFRVTSLFLNGRFSVLASVFRYGGKGSAVDNVCAGGFMVGIASDGALHARGHDTAGCRTAVAPDGRALKDCRIPSFPRVLEFVEKLHRRLPYVAIAGWDVALDATGRPLLIEFNSASFGVNSQFYHGPLLGDRFDEVMEYVMSAEKRRDMMRYGGTWRMDSQFPATADR